jgi:hypothetical protein
MLKVDTEFRYKGYGNLDSKCRIRIHEFGGIHIVVVSELDDNQGTSVTNASEHIAQQVCAAHELDSNYVVFIEHYPAEKGIRDDETYDLVMFARTAGGRLVSPKWKHLSKEAAFALIGGTP